MATWLHKLRISQAADEVAAAAAGPKTPKSSELGSPSARFTSRAPMENDNESRTIFRTWQTPSGIARHSIENGRTAQSFDRVPSRELQSFQVKFKRILQQLEKRVQHELRSGNRRSANHDRDVYQKFVRMVGVGPKAFQDLMTAEFGIGLTVAENDAIFKRFGKKTPEGIKLCIENHISRIIRNEASVGSWGGTEQQPMGMHMGMSIDFRNDQPTTFKKRAGAMPLQPEMGREDSMKLLTFGKAHTNYDGTMSNFNPNKLGEPGWTGVAMSPQFKPRHPAQRIGRRCQAGVMGANDQYNDSALVRGYTDVWVPPCGKGAWSVEPTHGGDSVKIGEDLPRPATVGRNCPPDAKLNAKNVKEKAPVRSHMLMTHQATKATGIRVRGGGGSVCSTPQASRRALTPAPDKYMYEPEHGMPMISPPRSRSSLMRSTHGSALPTGRSGYYSNQGFDPRQELFTPMSEVH